MNEMDKRNLSKFFLFGIGQCLGFGVVFAFDLDNSEGYSGVGLASSSKPQIWNCNVTFH